MDGPVAVGQCGPVSPPMLARNGNASALLSGLTRQTLDRGVAMSEQMRAGVSSEDGLVLRTVDRPVAGDQQVLVRVLAAGMNRADLNAAKGAGVASKASLGRPIGMEWAGEIVALGAGVTGFSPGERVMCSGTGGYAHYAVADAGRTVSIENAGLRFEEAAALPLALMTAHDAVVAQGRVKPGDTVLVHGGRSAVGLASLQIARLMGAGKIIATSTSPERSSRLADFGADMVLNSQDAAWPEQLLDFTDGHGADLVIDMVSGDSVNACMRASAILGRLINVGRLGGATRADFDFDLHALRRLTFVGVTFRTRSVTEVRDIVRHMGDDLWPHIQSGKLRLPVDRIFPLEEAPGAHEYMRSNAHFGKIVLKP